MMNREKQDYTQFAISHELLMLLQWIVKYKKETLKKIIQQSLSSGLQEKIQKKNNHNEQLESDYDPHYNVIEFFGLLEALLLDVASEQAIEKVFVSNLMPAIDHIDSTICDSATVRSSIENATIKLKKSPNENPEEILFNELLKRWKPRKKTITN